MGEEYLYSHEKASTLNDYIEFKVRPVKVTLSHPGIIRTHGKRVGFFSFFQFMFILIQRIEKKLLLLYFVVGWMTRGGSSIAEPATATSNFTPDS